MSANGKGRRIKKVPKKKAPKKKTRTDMEQNAIKVSSEEESDGQSAK